MVRPLLRTKKERLCAKERPWPRAMASYEEPQGSSPCLPKWGIMTLLHNVVGAPHSGCAGEGRRGPPDASRCHAGAADRQSVCGSHRAWTLPPRQARGALVLMVAAACWASPARAMCSSPQPLSQAGGGTAKQGLPGASRLLREGILSPACAQGDVDQEAIAQAAQELRIPPLQPSICKVPTEDMPPLSDDTADNLQPSTSLQARQHSESIMYFAMHVRPLAAQQIAVDWGGGEEEVSTRGDRFLAGGIGSWQRDRKAEECGQR